MATWPLTVEEPYVLGLPENFLADSYYESFAKNVLRSPMEVGPPKSRRRSTSGVKELGGVMYMTPDQMAVLTTFFETTLSDGALPFDWTHPRLGSTVTISCQFVEPPSFRRHDDSETIGWLVSINLEVLP
jgi:hypothetical protein